MKKATVFAIAFAAIRVFSLEAKAQSTEAPSTQQPQATEQTQAIEQPVTGKQVITTEQLPDGVKLALKSDVLKEWQVREIYKVTPVAQDAAAKPTYEVLFTNAEQKRAFARFDAEGKTVASQE
ncbi:hypothetical protein [Pontibacter pamirensis]|uniref:hypothetical protein n=1 Tax=Pontibacter pamirensis TaxID=2562824 RepID=UPI00138A0C8F|nr:hypothetical protein [Pontibacter pamirensis]